MTEDEARKKWCPHVALVKATEAVSGNAQGDCNCIASDCAMWVQNTDTRTVGNKRTTVALNTGYCGLTRQP